MRAFKALLAATGAAAVIAAGVVTAAGVVAASKSAEAETIRIGDINSYTRLPAHTIPYRQGAI
ncbi:MAG: ABC transporter substrate-binding protein, partial [Chloroflexi bacterium]|nr:ABC transporter substrate-binding protein [Chloroflexota bacterium]